VTSPILLLVGLGNPGDRYAHTRHNAGSRFVHQAAFDAGAVFRNEPKFNGRVASARIGGQDVRLFVAAAYMNESGRAIAGVARFYKVPVEQILVAHDELDLPPGAVRLKKGGGHGGHNGLRDVILHLGSRDFSRLRIGIGHPGSADQVVDYVLRKPAKPDAELMQEAIDAARRELPVIVSGEFDLAMNQLHSCG
jgi:PTH1 family peptidyl-tRNA hydrolase